jgi:hypothetical protein
VGKGCTASALRCAGPRLRPSRRRLRRQRLLRVLQRRRLSRQRSNQLRRCDGRLACLLPLARPRKHPLSEVARAGRVASLRLRRRVAVQRGDGGGGGAEGTVEARVCVEGGAHRPTLLDNSGHYDALLDTGRREARCGRRPVQFLSPRVRYCDRTRPARGRPRPLVSPAPGGVRARAATKRAARAATKMQVLRAPVVAARLRSAAPARFSRHARRCTAFRRR